MVLLLCPGVPDPASPSPAACWHLTCLGSAAPCDAERHGMGSPKNNTADRQHALA